MHLLIEFTVKDKQLYLKLKNKYEEVYYAYSLSGFRITLHAKYFFVTHSISDVNEFVSRKGILINMSHSIYPIKDMGFPYKNRSLIFKLYIYLRFPYDYLIKPDFAITSSEFTIDSTKYQCNISDISKIIVTGTPKTDYLLSCINDRSVFPSKNENHNLYTKNKKRILYLPTWREYSGFSLFDYNFDADLLNHRLNKINGHIGFNLHPFTEVDKKISNFEQYENINIYNLQGDEINKLLSKIDLLITDYSLLFTDFLIYDKPIIFAKFDHETYIKTRSLFVDYESLLGPKAENWPELINHLEKILLYEEDKYKQARRKLKKLIYPQFDGKARERIVKFVRSLHT